MDIDGASPNNDQHRHVSSPDNVGILKDAIHEDKGDERERWMFKCWNKIEVNGGLKACKIPDIIKKWT